MKFQVIKSLLELNTNSCAKLPCFINSKRLERGDVRIAQLAEQRLDKAKVVGSTPTFDTTSPDGRTNGIMYFN